MGPAIDQHDDSDDQFSNDDSELEESPLMQQINETKMKVCARVVGIIKRFSKTYGGSILSMD